MVRVRVWPRASVGGAVGVEIVEGTKPLSTYRVNVRVRVSIKG